MTEAQKFRFYFPAWNRCAKANNWRMAKGRLVAEEPVPDINLPQLAQVWTYARQIALRDHRGIVPDDLRHACHIVALKRDKSSDDLSNQEVNRVVALFDLLADRDNLEARMNWENPENKERSGLIESISRLAPEAYIQTITMGIWDTRNWKDLALGQLHGLHRKLRDRTPSWNRPKPQPKPYQQQRSVQQPAGTPNQFPKLQYIKKSTGQPVTAPTKPTHDEDPF